MLNTSQLLTQNTLIATIKCHITGQGFDREKNKNYVDSVFNLMYYINLKATEDNQIHS